MARRRRTPLQTISALGALLAGAWLCILIARSFQASDWTTEAERLPDLELVGVADKTAMETRLGRSWPQLPEAARDISLRQYAIFAEGDEGGPDDTSYTQFLRMRVPPEAVSAERYGLLDRAGRRRPVDERPPTWFPWVADQEDPWRVPTWWDPGSDGIGVYHAQDLKATWVGEYLHYDRDSGWLHVWEWRRRGIEPPPSPLRHLVVDLLAGDLARSLIAQGHPATADGWLRAPGLDPEDVAGAPELRPAGLQRIDACLLPIEGRHRYLLGLIGIDLDVARQLIGEVPMRELPADGPPPADWEPALPAVAGEARLPSWFEPGPGPRWSYHLRHPGSGALQRARWAAWSATDRTLYVWDWDAEGQAGG